MAQRDSSVGAARRASLAVAIGLLLSTSAGAVESQFDVRLGAGHSDNVARTEADPQSESLLGIGTSMDLTHESARIQATLAADLEYYEYLDDTFDSDVSGQAFASLTASLLPDRLNWVVENSFGQSQGNPFSPATPDNAENINYFNTGPDLMFGLGGRSQLKLYGRWGSVNYETSDFDNTRVIGGAQVNHALDRGSTLAFSVVAGRVEFDDASGSDYDTQEYFGTYGVESGRTSLSLDAGYRALHDNGETYDGPLFRASVQRELTENSRLGLRVGYEYGDGGRLLRAGLGNGVRPPGSSPDIASSGDVSENKYADLTWSLDRSRTRFNAAVGYRDEQYERDETLDRSSFRLSGSVAREFQRTLRGSLYLGWTDEQQDNTDTGYDEINATASLRWKPGKAFFGDFQARYTDRSGEGTAEGYDETQLWLWLGYEISR